MKLREVRRGPALDVPETTLPRVLLDRAASDGGRSSFLTRARPDAPFEPTTLPDFVRRVRRAAAGLARIGLQPGERVAILARTRLEWLVADYAILFAGGCTVTIYPTLPPEQVLHVLDDSGAAAVFVEDEEQLAKVREVRDRAPDLRRIVAFERPSGRETLTLEDLERRGIGLDAEVDRRVASTRPDDPATIIYTSGTTGVPKGARLTHRNWVAGGLSFNERVQLDTFPEVRTLVFLPLAHVASLILTRVLVDVPGKIAFGSPATFSRDLSDVRPTALLAVPRLWERIHAQVHKAAADAPPLKRKLFARADRAAAEWGRAITGGDPPSAVLRLRHAVWDALVYRKIRTAAGLDAILLAGSGAAAIRPDLVRWFNGIGVRLVEGYGLTEVTGTSNITPPDRPKAGAVGPTLATFEQAVAEDGEVLMRGPCVFQGYHNLPEENAAVFVEAEGRTWFASGDLGEFDEDGYLRILDRKKEIEVLDTGKKVAPVVVEEALKASPFVAEALLVATDRKFPGVLIQPDYDALVRWARDRGVAFDAGRLEVVTDPSGAPLTTAVGRDLLDRPEVASLFEEEVARANRALADFERVRTFRLVDRAWTTATQELTPTLKKRRREIRRNWSGLVEDMFR